MRCPSHVTAFFHGFWKEAGIEFKRLCEKRTVACITYHLVRSTSYDNKKQPMAAFFMKGQHLTF